MTPRDIRIAIAEANGYEWTMEAHLESGYHSWQNFADQCGNEVLDDELPDYCNDLNAIHEVELGLTTQKFETFWVKLASMYPEEARYAVSATALQRAEAYLRTIGKWNEKD